MGLLNWASGTTAGLDHEVVAGPAVLAVLSVMPSLTRFGRPVCTVGYQE